MCEGGALPSSAVLGALLRRRGSMTSAVHAVVVEGDAEVRREFREAKCGCS